MKKKFFRSICMIVSVFMIFASSFCVSADGLYSYIYNSDNEVVDAPPAVEVSFTLKNGFNSPQDLIVTKEGKIYVADTGNNRIVVLDSNGNLINEINGFEIDGENKTFNSPKGIFVTPNNDLYICDTSNSRIVHLNSEGFFVRFITLESGESLTEDFIFTPTKVAVDTTGRIFVVSEGFNNGLLEFTSQGEYIRYMGATPVALTASQLFWRTFSTKEQRKKSSSNVSTEYNNVEVDEQGFLMATSTAFTYWQFEAGKAQPLRKLNAKGSDVLSRVGTPYGDLKYLNSKTSRGTYKGPSALVDVCTLPYGNYGVLDQNRGRVFVYNTDGELLYEFGGPGNINGSITTATALDYFDERFYSLDSAKNQINVYSLNSYGRLWNSVSKAREELDYSGEEKIWNQIINENTNCELAMRGLGMAAYRKQDMKTAMKYFKEANDKENYSKAYVFVRRQWIESNAIWLLIGLIAVIAVGIFVSRKWKKFVAAKGKDSYFAHLQFSNYAIFHPIGGFWELKREKRGSVLAALTFVGLACIVKILSSVTTGFLFNNVDINDYSFLSDVMLVLAIVLLWSVTQWCVTVLMNGEGSFKDIFTATGYSLVPYIWLNAIAIISSQVLSLEEAELHTVLVMIGLIYTGFLLFMSLMSTHDYSLGKTFLVVVIILVVILLILFVALLIITFAQQMLNFAKDLYNEISLRI